jgi:hypothetical protein
MELAELRRGLATKSPAPMDKNYSYQFVFIHRGHAQNLTVEGQSSLGIEI